MWNTDKHTPHDDVHFSLFNNNLLVMQNFADKTNRVYFKTYLFIHLLCFVWIQIPFISIVQNYIILICVYVNTIILCFVVLRLAMYKYMYLRNIIKNTNLSSLYQ